MLNFEQWLEALENGKLDSYLRGMALEATASGRQQFRQRLEELYEGFCATYPHQAKSELLLCSAPGRTELLGNHTDHQGGKVLAAAVHLDALAMAAPNGLQEVKFQSKGWPLIQFELGDETPCSSEFGSTKSLLKGAIALLSKEGHKAFGLDIYCASEVLPGSGLSSSAAMEILMLRLFSYCFAGNSIDERRLAKMAQKIENDFFGKPSGLMDQMASSVGSAVYIDFAGEESIIEALPLDLDQAGYALFVIDSGADHADLTDEYAAIPQEMSSVAKQLGKKLLSEVEEDGVLRQLSLLRRELGDRAVLRSLHYFSENKRVEAAREALQGERFGEFLELVTTSGASSWQYLQNISPLGAKEHQELGLCLALADRLLEGEGAFRVHGGGFAGTLQAYVPLEKAEAFVEKVDALLGRKACHRIKVRQMGSFVFEL